jgi:hypothetical protein
LAGCNLSAYHLLIIFETGGRQSILNSHAYSKGWSFEYGSSRGLCSRRSRITSKGLINIVCPNRSNEDSSRVERSSERSVDTHIEYVQKDNRLEGE